MSSYIDKFNSIFTDYNALMTKAKVKHTENDTLIMQTSLPVIRDTQKEQEFLSDIQSIINEINATSEGEFDDSNDQDLLRKLKQRIKELVTEVFQQGQKKDSVELTGPIIEKDAELPLQDENGNTPLHLAILNGDIGLAERLIAVTKDDGLLLQNNKGCTPLHFAILKGNTELAERLIAITKDAGCLLKDKHGYTSLHWAIDKGNTELSKLLIAKNAGLELKNKHGYTPLHVAILKGNTELAELLIDKNVGLLLQDKDGNTPLHLAIQEGRTELAKHLLAVTKKDGLTLPNENGQIPLHLAVLKGYTELAELLIDKNVALALKDKDGNTPLHLAIDKGNAKLVKLLIAKDAGLFLQDERYKCTPLHFAIIKGDTKLAKLLIDKNAGLLIQDKNGQTPLHLAISKGYTELAKLIIAKDAGFLLKDKHGYTSLHWAIHKGNTELAKLIIAKDAGLLLKDKRGYTPLHFAIDKGNTELAELLIAKDTGLSLTDNYGQTPLHLAIDKGNTELAKLLITKIREKGADSANIINIPNVNGITPLHVACAKGLIDIAKFLIGNGANLNDKTKYGYTPLMCALTLSNERSLSDEKINCAKFLIDSGANVNLANNNGQTPLHVFSELNNEELIVLLLNKGANPYAADLDGNSLIVDAINSSPNEVPAMFKLVDDILKSRERELRKSQDLPPVEDHLLKGLEYNKVPVNRDGDTLLHIARRRGNEKLFQFLIDKGINFTDKNNYAETVFNIALDQIIYKENKLKKLLLEKESIQRSIEEDIRNLTVLNEQYGENLEGESLQKVRDLQKKIDGLKEKLTTIEKGIINTVQSLESLKKLAPVMANTITQIFEQYINNSKDILGDALSDADKFKDFETFIISRLPQILGNLKKDVNPLEFALALNNLHVGRAIAKELGKDGFEACLANLPANIRKSFKESLQYEIDTTHLANKIEEIPDLPNEPEYQFRRALLETFDEVSGYKEENPDVMPSPEFGKYLGDVDKTRSLKALRESLEKFISNCEKKEKIAGIESGKEDLFWNSIEKASTNTIKALSISMDSPAEIKKKKSLLMGEYLRLVGYCATRLDVEFDKLYYENCGIVRDLPGEIDFYLSGRRRLIVEGLAPRGKQSVHTIQAMLEALDGYNIPIKKSPDLYPEKLVLIDPETSFRAKYQDGLIDETRNFLQSNKDAKEAFFKMLEENGRYGPFPVEQTRWFFEYLKDNNGNFPYVLPEGVGDPKIWKDIYEVFKNMPFPVDLDDEGEWKEVLATYFHVTEWKNGDFAKIEASGNDAFKDLDPGLQKAVVDSGVKLDIFQTGSAKEKEDAKKKIQEKYIDDNFPTVSQKIKDDDVVFLLIKFNVLKVAGDAPVDVLFKKGSVSQSIS